MCKYYSIPVKSVCQVVAAVFTNHPGFPWIIKGFHAGVIQGIATREFVLSV